MRVPSFDGAREFATLAGDLSAAAQRVLESGAYILGDEVSAFEAAVAEYVSTAHAIGVASGTDALRLALEAAGIGAGDLVITSTFTFFATASAILNTGARPVLIDIDLDTFNIDVAAVERFLDGSCPVNDRLGIDPRAIKALVPVHLYGQAAAMDQLVALGAGHDLTVVEDAAQAFGAQIDGRKVGGMGELGCHSFFPTKNLGGFGDGGMVTTNDAGLASRIRMLRAHGSREKYRHEVVGINSRLDAVQAAMLQVRLEGIDEALEARRAHARAYELGFSGLRGLVTPAEAPNRFHTYNQYVVRITGGRRDEVQGTLASAGIGTAVYYPAPLHLQPALASLGYKEGDFPVVELASREVLALPMFPSLTDGERDYVVKTVREIIGT